jgi:hypothetical protein
LNEAELGAVLSIAKTPQALLKKLQPLWRAQERTPPAPATSAPQQAIALATPPQTLQRWSEDQEQVAALEHHARSLWATHIDLLLAQLAADRAACQAQGAGAGD